jgi:hypothetical protein
VCDFSSLCVVVQGSTAECAAVIKRESSKRESSKRESSKRESSKRESSKRESSKRESSKRESSKRVRGWRHISRVGDGCFLLS